MEEVVKEKNAGQTPWVTEEHMQQMEELMRRDSWEDDPWFDEGLLSPLGSPSPQTAHYVAKKEEKCESETRDSFLEKLIEFARERGETEAHVVDLYW